MFAETFSELRRRRGIAQRGFESVGVSSPYVHQVERRLIVPSTRKLELISSVFVKVALRQGVLDPEMDARLLGRERELTLIEREIIKLATTFAEEGRTELAAPLQQAIDSVDSLGIYERMEFTEIGLPSLLADLPNAINAAITPMHNK